MEAKPLIKSRTLAMLGALCTLYLTRWLAAKLPSELAHEVASALSDEVLGLLTAGITAAAAWLKKQDYSALADLRAQLAAAKAQADAAEPSPPKKVLAIPAKRKVPPVGTALLMVLTLGVLDGCASWPKTCDSDLGKVSCQCKRMTMVVADLPGNSSPSAARVRWLCDGAALPLTVDADALNLGK